MANRSLNKVMLIGNLTRDPELRYTPSGTAVCNFGLATNRQWVDTEGTSQESTEFHRIVAWGKLAELCSQLLFKGRKVYVEGRIQTREWTAQDGSKRSTTEIVIDSMLILDRKTREEGTVEAVAPSEPAPPSEASAKTQPGDDKEKQAEFSKKDSEGKEGGETTPSEKQEKETRKEDEVKKDDIPF